MGKKARLYKNRKFIFISLIILSAFKVQAAESDFQTPEYYASNGLDLVNAASAYAQGYTGMGVLVGLFDSQMRSDHPELAGKFEVILGLDQNGSQISLP